MRAALKTGLKSCVESSQSAVGLSVREQHAVDWLCDAPVQFKSLGAQPRSKRMMRSSIPARTPSECLIRGCHEQQLISVSLSWRIRTFHKLDSRVGTGAKSGRQVSRTLLLLTLERALLAYALLVPVELRAGCNAMLDDQRAVYEGSVDVRGRDRVTQAVRIPAGAEIIIFARER